MVTKYIAPPSLSWKSFIAFTHRDGPIIPIRSIIVRVEIKVPNEFIDYLGCDRHL